MIKDQKTFVANYKDLATIIVVGEGTVIGDPRKKQKIVVPTSELREMGEFLANLKVGEDK